MNGAPVSHMELKSLIHYSPETGEAVRLVTTKGRGKKGTTITKNQQDKNRYTRISLGGKRYHAARIIYFYMTGVWPECFIDHVNRDRQDNRWDNLRLTNNKWNMLNATPLKNNTSGVKGVCWHKQLQKWRAFIMVDKVQKHLGVTCDFVEAVCLRYAAEQCMGVEDWSYSSTAEQWLKSNQTLC